MPILQMRCRGNKRSENCVPGQRPRDTELMPGEQS